MEVIVPDNVPVVAPTPVAALVVTNGASFTPRPVAVTG